MSFSTCAGQMSNGVDIPIHSLSANDPAVVVQEIAYSNPYDFTQRHRHDYFEILFFKSGGGSQLIDFIDYPVRSNSCYIVQPNQVHLLKRGLQSKGLLLQFQPDSIGSARLLRLLQERIWLGKGAVIFEKNTTLSQDFEKYLEILSWNNTSAHRYKRETMIHHVQALLYLLLSVQFSETKTTPPDKDFSVFLSLIDTHHRAEHTVGFYLNKLEISEKKLGTLSKKHHGFTPLQVIHARVLLEAKRLLTFGEQSHKEIALDLGFDNPAAFSTFIKKKTGRTASELQREVTEIHRT